MGRRKNNPNLENEHIGGVFDGMREEDLDENCDEDDGERLNVYDAALIWMSNGKDEDYMFGYSEEELERALR